MYIILRLVSEPVVLIVLSFAIGKPGIFHIAASCSPPFFLRFVPHLFCDFIIARFEIGPVVIFAFQAKEKAAYCSCEYMDKSNKPRL